MRAAKEYHGGGETPKPLPRRAPATVRQQFGDDPEMRRLQRDYDPGWGTSGESGDRYNKAIYELIKYVEGKRSRGEAATYDQGGRFPRKPLKVHGQNMSEIMTDDQGKEFVWWNRDEGPASPDIIVDGEFVRDPQFDKLSESDKWKSAGAVKIYGDFNKWFSNHGSDDQMYSITPSEGGNYDLDEGGTQGNVGREEAQAIADEARGGQGASATEDLLERLSQYKRGNKYAQGGKVKGYSMEVAGAKAQGPIQTSEEGEQYVSMELPNGEIATVFGDWESYGNPSRERVIEDMNYRIVPLGDGTYSLDVGEMESKMVRDEVGEFGEQATGGPGASRMEDLMEKLSDHKGPSKFAVRAARRQR